MSSYLIIPTYATINDSLEKYHHGSYVINDCVFLHPLMGCFLDQFSAGALSIVRCIEGVNYLSDLVIGEKFRYSIRTKDQGAISIELSFDYFYIWSWYYSKFLSYCVSERTAHCQTWAIIIFCIYSWRPYLPSLMIFIMIDPSIHADNSLTLSSHVRFVISA